MMRRIGLALTASVGLTGCAAGTPEPAAEAVGTDLANPAATFCVGEGNEYVIRSGNGGSVGICILPDGSEVDAWDYFRANGPAAESGAE